MKKIAILLTIWGLIICFDASSAFAYFGFDLVLPDILWARPGDTVNVPAKIYNSGTETIWFRSYVYEDFAPVYTSYPFYAQFSNQIIDPGEYLDFIFCNISFYDTVPIGYTEENFLMHLGLGFPGSVYLDAMWPGPNPPGGLDFHPNALMTIIISNQTAITPINSHTPGYEGYYGSSGAYPYGDRSCVTSVSSGISGQQHPYEFGTVARMGLDPDAINPEVIPEPSSLALLGLGLLGLFRRRKKS